MMMKDFFKNELQVVHLKTGIRQFETIMAKPNGPEEANILIDLMVKACDYPPFNLIGIDVKQRVIQQAIIEDKDFIGLNAKFVVRALNTWWHQNKDRYYEKHLINPDPAEPQGEPLRGDAMQKMLDEWKTSLGIVENNFHVPKLTDEEIKREGQEREDSLKAELDKLAPRMNYKAPDPEWLMAKERIKSVCATLYGRLSSSEISSLRNFEVSDKETGFKFTILCESQSRAEEIYIEALTLNEK